MNEEVRTIRIGNIYGDQYGTGFAGNVYLSDGIAPALMTMAGGQRQPLIIVDYDRDNVEKRL